MYLDLMFQETFVMRDEKENEMKDMREWSAVC